MRFIIKEYFRNNRKNKILIVFSILLISILYNIQNKSLNNFLNNLSNKRNIDYPKIRSCPILQSRINRQIATNRDEWSVTVLDENRNIIANINSSKPLIPASNIKLFTTITNTLAKDKAVNDSWRKLPSPVSGRNLSNVVEDEVVDSLAKSVINYYPKLSYRYYSLKAEWFGVKRLKYWDRNAPLPFQTNKLYSWNDAKEIVLK